MTNSRDRKPDVEYITEYEGAKVEYKVYITPSKVGNDNSKDNGGT